MIARVQVGLALKPATPAELALPYLQQGLLDMVRCAGDWGCRCCDAASSIVRAVLRRVTRQVLVLTVEPGFGGQSFKPAAAEKCRLLRAAHPELLIEVDGGITVETAAGAWMGPLPAACGNTHARRVCWELEA